LTRWNCNLPLIIFPYIHTTQTASKTNPALWFEDRVISKPWNTSLCWRTFEFPAIVVGCRRCESNTHTQTWIRIFVELSLKMYRFFPRFGRHDMHWVAVTTLARIQTRYSFWRIWS
jgi:hypothetical protein